MPPKRGKTAAASAQPTASSSRPRRSTAATPKLAASEVKEDTTSRASKSSSKKRKTPTQAEADDDDDEEAQQPARKRKAPATSKASSKNKTESKSSAKTIQSLKPSNAAQRDEDERCFWLMKAEPESRLEKGHDVRFSIDDLRRRTEPEPWDGVRNAVESTLDLIIHLAQKNMKNMRKEELAFFYHSNCKIPGIAGVMKIVQEHSTDESAFDSEHPYYDPKSKRDSPRWIVVHIEFVKKFDELVPLKRLQEHAKIGDPLETLQTLKQSRLSVSRVTPDQWSFILELAGQDESEVEELAKRPLEERVGDVE